MHTNPHELLIDLLRLEGAARGARATATLRSMTQEKLDLLEEPLASRLVLHKEMVASLECNKSSTGNVAANLRSTCALSLLPVCMLATRVELSS
jgi:hypothetical protein